MSDKGGTGVGGGGGGWVHLKDSSNRTCLGLAVEMPWLALKDHFCSFWTRKQAVSPCRASPAFKTCFSATLHWHFLS